MKIATKNARIAVSTRVSKKLSNTFFGLVRYVNSMFFINCIRQIIEDNANIIFITNTKITITGEGSCITISIIFSVNSSSKSGITNTAEKIIPITNNCDLLKSIFIHKITEYNNIHSRF